MRKFFKKPISKVLAVLLIMSLIPAAAFGKTAEVDINPDVSGSKTAAPTELNPEARQTKVTLSLPSAEYQNKIDIVFVTDSSSSTDMGEVFIDASTNLFAHIVENNPGVELKVGVVLFTGRGNDAIDYVSEGAYKELTPYNNDTKDYFEQSFKIRDTMTKATFQATFGRGSGLHGGLDMADEWLTADTDVDDSNKYVVLYTDGKGYIWNDENNVPTTIYSQIYKRLTDSGKGNNVGVTDAVSCVYNAGKMSLDQAMGYNKGSYGLDVLDRTGKSNIVFYNSYETLYALTDEELTGVNEWDQKCTYAIDTTTPAGSVVKHPTTNGVELFGNGTNYAYWFEWIPDEAWEGVPYLQINPYRVKDNGDGTYTFITEVEYDEEGKEISPINPYYYQYHFDCLQKGLYKAGHLWTDMNDKYNCAVVTYDGSTGGGLELVGPFKEWIRAHSKFSAAKEVSGKINAMFEGIDNSIRYMVASGVVTDTIPGEFTLVKNEGEVPFTMTVGGVTLTSAADGENKWNFGEADATGKYPYVIEFSEADNSYTWTINVPIENIKPVTLSYNLEIDVDTPDGEYPTNTGAVLAYTTSEGKDGEFEFEIPKVTYGRLYTITYDLNGGTSTQELVYKERAGADTPKIDDPTRKGYNFMGWNPEVADKVTGDATYVAKWEPAGIGGGGGPSGSVKYVLKYESNGGTEYPDEYYSAGTRVHLDKTPIKKDYTFTGWYADEELTKPISEVLMNSDHTVYAGWEKTPVPEFFGPDHINFIVGYPDGMVHPEANITRAEVTSIFFRLLDEEVRNTNMSKTNPFGDVSEDDWFNTSVSTMSRLGIVKGYEDGDFHPNSPITRAEFAAIAARFDKRATNGSTAFSDIAGHWAELEIIKAAENGWVSGYPDGTFQPNKNITRAEAVAIVNRVLSRNPESEADLLEGMLRFPDNSNISIWYYLDIQEAANSHEYERKENNTEKWTQLIPLEDWVSIER